MLEPPAPMPSRATERQSRLVQCLEALYAWERDDEHWLREAMNAVGAIWEKRVWTYGILYDASSADVFEVERLLFNDDASEPVRLRGRHWLFRQRQQQFG